MARTFEQERPDLDPENPTWIVLHNLGTLYPFVDQFDVDGRRLEVQIEVIDENTIEVLNDEVVRIVVIS